MNELSTSRQEQTLGPAAEPRALAPYGDRVFHRLRTHAAIGMLNSDLDYTIEQQQLSRSGLNTVTQIVIKDIRTQQPLKTVEIRLEREVSLAPEQFYVVRKAQSDPRRLVLRHSQVRHLFYEVDMTRQDAAYTVHSLQAAQPPHRVFVQYYEYEANTPICYRDKIYYLGADWDSDQHMTQQITLCWLHLPDKRFFRYRAGLFLPGYVVEWALRIEPQSGLLTAWCGVQHKLTQIDTANDTIRFSRVLDLKKHKVRNLFPAGDAEHCLFLLFGNIVCCLGTQTGAPVFSLNLDVYLNLPQGAGRDLKEMFRVHQAVLNRDQTFLALVVSSSRVKCLFLYDVAKQVPALACDLSGHHAFPLYCRKRLEAEGFSPDAVEKTEAAARMLYCAAPLGRQLTHGGQAAYSLGRHSGYGAPGQPVNFFDHFTLRLHAEHTEISNSRWPVLGMGEARGTVLFEKSESGGAGQLPVILCAYHIPSHTVLDTLEIGGLIDTDDTAEGGFTCPALRFRGKNWPLGGSVLAALNAQGKIELIPDAGAVEDITENACLRSSRDRRSLYLVARPNAPAVSLMPEPGQPFLRAMFSRRQGCVDVFYLSPDRMLRFDLSRVALGDRAPLAALPVAELRSGPLRDIVRESPDGRYLYQLYETRNQERRLRVSEVETAQVIRDLPLKAMDTGALRLGYVEPENRFITLVGKDETVYLHPFTGDILARLSLYGGEKFLLRSWQKDGEGKYFYTNAPELISVYERDLTGTVRLLEKGDARRRQYLQLYNSQQKMQELLYRPHLFAQGQQRLQALLRLSAAGQDQPETAAARPPRLES